MMTMFKQCVLLTVWWPILGQPIRF